MNSPHTVLSIADHNLIDQLIVERGASNLSLIEAAGRAVSEEISARWTPSKALIMCGPGKNGADGCVVAKSLQEKGWDVTIGFIKDPLKSSGYISDIFHGWMGPAELLNPLLLDNTDIVIDALFGAGFRHPISDSIFQTLKSLSNLKKPVVAIDLPSGVDGDEGTVHTVSPKADLTVTFFKHKFGHLLYPGRAYCGEVVVLDIGIPDSLLDEISCNTWINEPLLWKHLFPWPKYDDHKYRRGHVLVVSGGVGSTGAARLASVAAYRVGSGLVTLACPTDALSSLTKCEPEFLLALIDSSASLYDLLLERKRNAVLIGPGNGLNDNTRENVLSILDTPAAAVIDADALTVFSEYPEELFKVLDETCILTPHDGEFNRLFPFQKEGGRLSRARNAAKISGAVIVLKGPDTVVAHPDGRATITNISTPFLATAGSGDVLGGIIIGLRAQGVPSFEASSMGVWLHAKAATHFGPGLIASDISSHLPRVLRDLWEKRCPKP